MNKYLVQIILLILAIVLATFSVFMAKPKMHKTIQMEQIIFKRVK